jgi:hypothetical protein
MQPEASDQRAISLGEYTESNIQPKILMRRRFERHSFPAIRLNNGMNGDQA